MAAPLRRACGHLMTGLIQAYKRFVWWSCFFRGERVG
jgi:hypothetical protein